MVRDYPYSSSELFGAFGGTMMSTKRVHRGFMKPSRGMGSPRDYENSKTNPEQKLESLILDIEESNTIGESNTAALRISKGKAV